MHGDGGKFSKQDSLYTLSWNSLLATGTTMNTRLLSATVRKSDMTADTMDTLLRIFAWSCNVLLSGESPSKDYEDNCISGGNTSLADGYRACLLQIRGDWEWYTQIFHVPSWNGADAMCCMSKASGREGPLYFGNCADDAHWRSTHFTHESLMAHLRYHGFPLPILLLHVIGLRLECICIDVLHAVNQGIASHIIGNVVFIIVVLRNMLHGGTTFAQRVDKLNQHLTEWYKRVRCKVRVQGRLTLDSLRTTKAWPKLKAKAAGTRYLARYALYLMESFGDGSDPDRLAQALCESLVEFYDILASESMFLSRFARERLPVLGCSLAQLYTKLASHAFWTLQTRLWKIPPKLHMWEHLTEDQALI